MRKAKIILINIAILVFILAIALLVSKYTKGYSEKDLYGTWSGKFKGSEVLLQFNRNKTCALNFKGTASGSTETIEGTFETDFSKEPVALNISDSNRPGQALYTIIQFSGNKVVNIAPFVRLWRLRPLTLDPETSMKLEKEE